MIDIQGLTESIVLDSSRELFSEAMRAYHGRAYKASIINLWIALTEDLISKIKILAAQGNNRAIQFIQNLNGNIESRNISKILEIERDILNRSCDDYQLITEEQKGHLDVLRDDRNICAHPSFNNQTRSFSAETVRFHAYNAVTYVLSQQAVQGKEALNKILTEILSETVPGERQMLKDYFFEKYLKNCHPQLLSNLTKALISGLITQDENIAGYEHRIQALIELLSEIDNQNYKASVISKIDNLISKLNKPDDFRGLFQLLNADNQIFWYISSSNQTLLRDMTSSYTEYTPDFIFSCVNISTLREPMIASALSYIEDNDGFHDIYNIQDNIEDNPCIEFVPFALNRLRDIGSFRGAERVLSELIIPHLPFMDNAQVNTMIANAACNYEVWDASRTPSLMIRIVRIQQQNNRHIGDIEFWEELIAKSTESYQNLESIIRQLINDNE